jgi:hypothetical protein
MLVGPLYMEENIRYGKEETTPHFSLLKNTFDSFILLVYILLSFNRNLGLELEANLFIPWPQKTT